MGWLFNSAERFVDKVIYELEHPRTGTLSVIDGGPPYLPEFQQLPLGSERTQILEALERRRGALPGPALERLNAVIDAYRDNLNKPPSPQRTPTTITGRRG